MMDEDYFSQWLGIEILEKSEGACKLRMMVRDEMQNGFGVVHGGITYSFADSALAFACNSRGVKAMSIETSISHTHPVHAGDTLTAIAKELSLKKKIAVYEVEVKNQNDEIVALFKGTVYRSGKVWEL
ncbi:MAG: hydroxyphenylacetyl-CoA thioesterase PaaI [Flavobacteriales bacterium]|nr:hydroxyphenylacetyl-CoA thioesterase PaaI [Flavobacteriales bacterium]NNK80500.1 hydroxyphenylacetyl-CoA thioesterase PaaI [Flavobacteriales bacterium]